MIKLFVSDIDGTLLTNRYEYENGISDRNLSALERLQKNNIHIALATGRHHDCLSRYQKHKNLQFDTVANTGAYVYFNKKIIYKKYFTKRMILRMLDDFPEIRHKLIFSDMKVRKVFYSTAEAEEFVKRINTDTLYTNFGEIIKVGVKEFLMSSNWLPPIQILCSLDNPTEVSLCLSRFSEWGKGKINAVRSDNNTIDIVRSPGCKSHGIKIIMRRLNIKTNEVAGIGDSYNDIGMLNICAEKFCMATANDEVKKHAKMIVNDVSEAAEIVLSMNDKERIGAK